MSNASNGQGLWTPGLPGEHRQPGNGLRLLAGRRPSDTREHDLHGAFVRRRQALRATSGGGRHVRRVRIVDPAGELAFDGVAGARDGSFPSIDIANGSPTGANAPDTIVMTWCDGPTPTNTSPGPNEQAIVQYSTNRGSTWTRIGNRAEAGDRPDFPAIAISPDGRDVYLVYMASCSRGKPLQRTPA